MSLSRHVLWIVRNFFNTKRFSLVFSERDDLKDPFLTDPLPHTCAHTSLNLEGRSFLSSKPFYNSHTWDKWSGPSCPSQTCHSDSASSPQAVLPVKESFLPFYYFVCMHRMQVCMCLNAIAWKCVLTCPHMLMYVHSWAAGDHTFVQI